MTYRITYTTDTHPTDLPDGATVEKVSALPLKIDEGRGANLFTLAASGNNNFLAYFQIEDYGRQLTRDQTVQVRDALNELLGEANPVERWDRRSEPPIEIKAIRDREDDVWYRLADGTWSTYRFSNGGVPWSGPGITPSDYAPFEVVDPK